MKELKMITDFVGDSNYKEIDYNLLMRAVDKIETIPGGHGGYKYNVTIEQCFVEIIDTRTSDTIEATDGVNKLRAICNAVVGFIEATKKIIFIDLGDDEDVVGYIKYTDEGKYYSVSSYSLESASPDFDSTDFLADYFEDRGKLVVIEPDANDWR